MMLALVALTATLAAQAQFATGLGDLYAYDGPAAAAAFDAAASVDPHFALAFWGKALADGSDLNTPLTPASFAAAQADVARAIAREAYASPDERALIDAVAARYRGSYDDRDSDERAYRTAMESYVDAHPDDDDAAMLLVEDLLETRGMSWDEHGAPLGATSAEILSRTNAVLARTPQQLFANHLCIHIYDRAPDRAPAIACAQRLDAMSFTPAQEHAAHMPAHTWIELGDGAAAVASSERAWQLQPTRYAEHDAYVGLSAAMMDGDAAAIARWSARLGNVQGSPPNLDPPPYVLDALRAERTGNVDRALAILRENAAAQANAGELVPLYPASPRVGALLFRAGRYAEAREAFTQALSAQPDLPRALFGMAQTLRSLGDAADAATYERSFARYWRGGALTMDDF